MPCVLCPEGGICDEAVHSGSTTRPAAQAGWVDISANRDGSSFARCLRPAEACQGGAYESQCKEGYQGYMCNECAEVRERAGRTRICLSFYHVIYISIYLSISIYIYPSIHLSILLYEFSHTYI